ncbi:DUF6801 domain-containing protein [Amycolatopsis vastitatis]|uniref:DUF6801 domain-containing protein n=1 Tax=Amycolatopsis vastitatis TaxID=1905142 RepID=UPI001F0A202D|nr:DUF6801 domain-containing protein [Amycolatopsis vastitatis]
MRIGTALAAALLVTGVTAGTACASTTVTVQTGVLTYTCAFPGFAPQATMLTAQLDVTDLQPGQPFTVVPYATQVFPSSLRALLRGAGYDAVRGSYSGSFTVSGATPPSGSVGGDFPEQPIGTTGTVTLPVAGPIQTFTADPAGTLAFAMGPSLSEGLQFHRASTGAWVVWSVNCTLKVTNPGQNPAFQPAIVIS